MSVASPRPASPRVDSRVVGVDVNPDKVESVRQGRSPVVEEKIGELTAEVVTAGMLTVTTDAYATVLGTDISLICVGTPSTTCRRVIDEIPRTGDHGNRCGPSR